MITRAREKIVIVGHVPTSHGEGEPHTERRRIVIDRSSGSIESVEDASGSAATGAREAADLDLGPEHVIFPGFVDPHVHAREDATGEDNYKEDFRTAGEAAVNGGVTVFAEMPNNPRPPIDARSYAEKRELTRKSPADVLLYALVGINTQPLPFPAPYKVYMAQSIGDFFFSDERTLRETLPRYRGQFVAFHAEHPDILRENESQADHYSRRPPEAEVRAIEFALRLCESYHIEAHICHLSTAEGLARIREARARGARVTTEVTPHHLYYDQENIRAFGRPDYLQCNPPPRTRADRLALLEALRSGEIDWLATDHAPHTIEEKDRGTSGVTHLDTYGNFIFWLLQEGFTYADILRVCSENPGRFVSRFLPRRYGRIAPGCVGSLSIVRRGPVTVRRAQLKTKAGWSCFEGQTFDGHVTHTVVRGRIYPRSVNA